MAENIYTQSKTPKLDGTVNYLTNFKDKTKLDNKLTHYAKKTLVFPTQNKTEQVLNMEDRIVELEGFANQLMTELCLKNKNAYTWC
jgi:hypothetical protein